MTPYRAHDSTVSLYQVPEFVVGGEKMLFHALYGNEAYEKLRKFHLLRRCAREETRVVLEIRGFGARLRICSTRSLPKQSLESDRFQGFPSSLFTCIF